MATWAIGDLQGCFDSFMSLLQRIDYRPGRDRLWLAGDLINRGPKSLEVLRWCFQHQNDIEVVLGNHDLHFLAVAYGAMPVKGKDTFNDILDAQDCNRLVDWLRHQPLIHADQGHIMVHAGISPQWSLAEALDAAAEVEEVLRSDEVAASFQHMYGNQPERWSGDLEAHARHRYIINAFTRMRIVAADGALELRYKKGWKQIPKGYTPWFDCPTRVTLPHPVLFGHWAAIEGETGHDDIIALDTGCVWGGRLTAYCLESGTLMSVRAEEDNLVAGDD